ncbi:nuclear receptor ROR-gamma-like [Pelodytes ibericus]
MYSCTQQQSCQIDRASRNRCQHCRLQKCLSLGMSRNAVKFGRMSKKQRDILQAEVQKHRLREASAAPRSSHHDDTETPVTSPRLIQSFPTTSWSSQARSSCSVYPSLAPRDPFHQQPHTPEKPTAEATHRKPCFRDQQLHPEQVTPGAFHRLHFVQNPQAYCRLNITSSVPPECMMSITEQDLLMQNVVLAHQETCQFLQENLQVLRWESFSPEEVHGFQQKPMEQMWERCVCHITNAIQYIVEFAKRLSGFMELNPNDQIVLLKAGAMELLLIRMSRAFNCYNSTIFFEGKYAQLEIFQSLGCSDLIGSMFDLCHSLCALNLSDQEMALLSAMILLDPSRSWLQDKQRVEILRKKLELSLRYLLQTTHREFILSKLPQKGRLLSICQLHMQKLNIFQQMYPGMACERFPPLYKELFLSDAELS